MERQAGASRAVLLDCRRPLWCMQRDPPRFVATYSHTKQYDQGMMSLINTNSDYLTTMGIAEEDPLVGVIVSVYYLGCAVGAVIASYTADKIGRRPALFSCLAISTLGNLLMFISGLGMIPGGMPAMAVMFTGRIIMGLGVGGIDSVVPVYSSELSEDDSRGKALAQEFQANILGLNIAFAVNLAVTHTLGKGNEVSYSHYSLSRLGSDGATGFIKDSTLIVFPNVTTVGMAHSNRPHECLPFSLDVSDHLPPRISTLLHLSR